LVGISVIVADRMARTIVRPTQNLARAARELGDGALDATVEPQGPAELVELAVVFNDLGSLISSMLVRERELVAELSHRLRTPLTTLRLRLDQVADEGLSTELRKDVDGVTAVVNDLINEARGTLVPVSGCDLGEAVSERAEFWRVLAEDQERVWHFDRGGSGLWVDVTRSDLVATVDVLLQNVFAHTPDGSPLTIGFGRTGKMQERPMVKLWVSDGGDGIAPELLERGDSSMGSTGLGLDIARRLAEGAGGGFEIGIGEHGGAEVVLRFPLRSAPTD
ncbi:MAG: HAMP domain-containing histidine kinase, partial [Actinobacteria bacterium]|nr:HAMP domain-containing histidine kinase [Actinomycetota bacterium]